MTGVQTCALPISYSKPSSSGGSAEAALVDPVTLDHAAAHPLHRPVHRVVGLEDPAHVAAARADRGRRLHVALVEGRGDAEVLVVVLDPEREDPQTVDVTLAAKEVDPAEWEHAAVHLRQGLLDVGQSEGGADHLAVARPGRLDPLGLAELMFLKSTPGGMGNLLIPITAPRNQIGLRRFVIWG